VPIVICGEYYITSCIWLLILIKGNHPTKVIMNLITPFRHLKEDGFEKKQILDQGFQYYKKKDKEDVGKIS